MLLTAILTGCVGTTPIGKLSLPPVTTIEGNVTKIEANGFLLKDSSGEIYVKAELPNDKMINVTIDEKVKVYGNIRSGKEGIFDGYVIKKSSGEQIIVSMPSPHIGFIFQTSFEK